MSILAIWQIKDHKKIKDQSYTLVGTVNALARSRIVTHSNTASFSIKTTSYETNNIFQEELLKDRQNKW